MKKVERYAEIHNKLVDAMKSYPVNEGLAVLFALCAECVHLNKFDRETFWKQFCSDLDRWEAHDES